MKLNLSASILLGALSLWALLGLTITPASAQVFSTLHSFSGSYGQYPHAGPVIDSSRNLYATTNSGAEPVDLSALSSFRVLGLDRCGIHVQGSTTVINGDVGLGPQCRSDMRSGRIAGNLILDPTVSAPRDAALLIRGVTQSANLSAIAAAAGTASRAIDQLTPTQHFQHIKIGGDDDADSRVTVTGNGGVNVIDVGSIEIARSGVLEIAGGSSDFFYINVRDGYRQKAGSSLITTGGVSPENIVFNFPPFGDARIDEGSNAIGTFLSPNGSVEIERSVLAGHVFARQIELSSGADLRPLPRRNALTGDPTSLAATVIDDFDANAKFFDPQDYDTLNDGTIAWRPIIDLIISASSTVAQVNSALASVSGEIIFSIAGSRSLALQISDPGTYTGTESVMQSLLTQPGVEDVTPHFASIASEVPAYYLGQTSVSQYMAHHLAVGGQAAWNAREAPALISPPTSFVGQTLLVADAFGDGPPKDPAQHLLLYSPDVPLVDTNFGQGFNCEHGYHVLGIAAGAFDSPNFAIAGLYPGYSGAGYVSSTFDWRAIELGQPFYVPIGGIRLSLTCGKTLDPLATKRMAASLDSLTKLENRKVVANTSFDLPDTSSVEQWVQQKGGFASWKLDISSADPDRFLITAAAGNDNSTPAQGWNYNAAFGEPWNYLALVPDGSGIVAENILVVENREFDFSSHDSVGCLSPNSYRKGNISAIGSRQDSTTVSSSTYGVWSYIDAAGTPGIKSGTSMAAPQVAGLAMYLWELRPDLKSSQIVSLIKANSRKVTCQNGPLVNGAPVDDGENVIDAYRSVLATDFPAALLASDASAAAPLAPARTAILNVSRSNPPTNPPSFQLNDVLKVLQAIPFLTSGQEVDVFESPTMNGADLSVYDFNGDGYVGSSRMAPFPLSINVDQGSFATTYGTVTIGTPPLSFNEANVSDMDVLCYYVHTPLFATTSGGDLVKDRIDAMRAFVPKYSGANGSGSSCGWEQLSFNVNQVPIASESLQAGSTGTVNLRASVDGMQNTLQITGLNVQIDNPAVASLTYVSTLSTGDMTYNVSGLMAGTATVTVYDPITDPTMGHAAKLIVSVSGQQSVTAVAGAKTDNLTVNTAMAPFSPFSSVTGGTPPYTYILSGSLPAGLGLNVATGVVSGTPTAVTAGTTATFSVADSKGQVASVTNTVTFVVTEQCPPGSTTCCPPGTITCCLPGSTTCCPPGTTCNSSWTIFINQGVQFNSQSILVPSGSSQPIYSGVAWGASTNVPGGLGGYSCYWQLVSATSPGTFPPFAGTPMPGGSCSSGPFSGAVGYGLAMQVTVFDFTGKEVAVLLGAWNRQGGFSCVGTSPTTYTCG